MPELTLLSDQEVQRCLPPRGVESGFGMLETSRGALPLKALEVRTDVTGLLYRACVQQTFVNTHREPLEATYIFPLPDRASVSRFVLKVGGREIDGELKERAAARREYNEAIRAGHRAAIAEEDRPNVFNLRVGNIMPGEEARVELVMDGPLDYADGEATFRFPLVVAPRYIPGTALPGDSVGSGVAEDTDAVPDASRVTPPVLLPGFPNPVQLGLSLEIDPAGLPVKDFRSSLHGVTAEPSGEGHMRVKVNPGERLNRDFILRFNVGDKGVSTSLAIQPDERDKEKGTFSLTLVPPADTQKASRARDIIFVLDRSGSMGGWKMVAARRAVARMIDTLTDQDRFDIFAFDSILEAYKVGDSSRPQRGERIFWDAPSANEEDRGPLAKADQHNRSRAIEFVSKIDARGGTEMASPLTKAVECLDKIGSARERILVLVTDGQVGNEKQILRALGAKLTGIRVFTLGIDRAVNEAFLRQLAKAGGGLCEMVETEERLDEVMDRIHRGIGTPVLTELSLNANGFRIESDTVAPKRLPDLFEGSVVRIQGRYTGSSSGSLDVRARDGQGGPWDSTVTSNQSENEVITKIWARANLRDLEDQVASGCSNADALKRRIVETSLTHTVLCSYTAFVAVDRKEKVNVGGRNHEVVQPVETPEGWGGPGVLCAPPAAAGMTPAPALAPTPAMAQSAPMDAIMRSEVRKSAALECAAFPSAPVALRCEARSRSSGLKFLFFVLLVLAMIGALAFWWISSAAKKPEKKDTPPPAATSSVEGHTGIGFSELRTS